MTDTVPRAEPTSPVPAASSARPWPANPIQVQRVRGEHVESVHRGAWVLVDDGGATVAASGDSTAPVFARSSVKSLQALPLVETGAARRYGFDDRELALALASHDGAAAHVDGVRALLGRLGLGPEHLRCGPQVPNDRASRRGLEESGASPTALHNNCSGKHAGFLALALHLGVAPESYLDPESAGQELVREAIVDMGRIDPAEVSIAIDGCSAPTFRLPLVALATAFARIAAPRALPAERRAACERLTAAAARHPEMIAGENRRLCTAILRASGGRVFPKIGAEGIYALARREGAGEGRALAVKMDDGGKEGLEPLVVDLLERFGWLGGPELAALESYRARTLTNRAGLVVGRTVVVR